MMISLPPVTNESPTGKMETTYTAEGWVVSARKFTDFQAFSFQYIVIMTSAMLFSILATKFA